MPRTLMAAFIALAVACGGSGAKQSTEATVPAKKAPALRAVTTGPLGPPAFKYIPADSPYVLGANSNTSWMKGRLEILGFALQELYRELKTMRKAMTGEQARIVDGLFDLLGDELTSASMARIGLPVLPGYYIYGIGLMPVLRMPLVSGDKLRAAADKIALLIGKALPKQHVLRGTTYWYLPKILGSKKSLSVAIAIVDNDLVVGLVVDELKKEMLPLVLGIDKPAQSLASSPRLRQLVKQYSVNVEQLMLIDLYESARQLFGVAGGLEHRIVEHAFGKPPTPRSPACLRELMSLASLVPRMVGGPFATSATHTRGTFVIELHDDVVHALRSSRGDIPGGDLSGYSGPMSVGLGIDPEQLGVQLVSAARRIQKAPYRCSELSGLNQAAQTMASVAVEPLLKQVGSPTGIAAVISGLDEATSKFEGAMVVTGRDMATLWGLLQANLPMFQNVAVAEDGAPVPVPGAGSPTAPVFAARTESLLGASIGQGSDGILGQLMAGAPRSDDALIVMHYDESFGNGDSQKKLFAALQKWGFHAAVKRIEARLAAAKSTTRGSMVFRIGKRGLAADYQIGN